MTTGLPRKKAGSGRTAETFGGTRAVSGQYSPRGEEGVSARRRDTLRAQQAAGSCRTTLIKTCHPHWEGSSEVRGSRVVAFEGSRKTQLRPTASGPAPRPMPSPRPSSLAPPPRLSPRPSPLAPPPALPVRFKAPSSLTSSLRREGLGGRVGGREVTFPSLALAARARRKQRRGLREAWRELRTSAGGAPRQGSSCSSNTSLARSSPSVWPRGISSKGSSPASSPAARSASLGS